jgi:hypothetical protein
MLQNGDAVVRPVRKFDRPILAILFIDNEIMPVGARIVTWFMS